MSNLPPRPEYPPPGRYDTRHRDTLAFPPRPAPMAPENSYAHERDQDRDHYPPRSPPPPRHRIPPDRGGDSYIAPGPYKPREPYPPRLPLGEQMRREYWDRHYDDLRRGGRDPRYPLSPDSERRWRRDQYEDPRYARAHERRRDLDERAWTRREDGDRRRDVRRDGYDDRAHYSRRSPSPPPRGYRTSPLTYGTLLAMKNTN